MTFAAGSRLGAYEIVAPLGSGGMGVVYRAYDAMLQRTVAIKFVGTSNAVEESRADSLLQEARAASALNHPNICTVYEVGAFHGDRFIVMEFVDGPTLRDLIPAGGMPVETALRHGIEIAGALAFAHDHGIVHRDLKSSNVAVTAEGRAKVLDFGVAKRVAAAADATRTNDLDVTAGTLAYMAPEALRGGVADARADIWSLGVLLYEMVSGRRPFDAGTGVDLASAIVRDPAAPLPARVPATVRGTIQRCLTKDPTQRYQRASEVRAALEIALANVASESASSAQAGRKRSWPMAAIGTAAVLVAIALAAGIGTRLRPGGPAAPPRIESLAVLPLENLSRDPDQDFFADGMTDALITNLSKIGALRVISRTSVMQYKRAPKPPREVAALLHVDALVEGSVVRSGSRVRIAAQLIDPATGRNIWANSYDRDSSDVLTLQEEVARAIANEIKVTVTPEERARLAGAKRVDPAAHEAYLKGRMQVDKRTRDGFNRAIDDFQRALAIDPGFGEAHAGLADAFALVGYFGFAPPAEAYARAQAAARKALDVNDSLAEAHEAMAMAATFSWEWRDAEREFKRAIELNPGFATAHHWYSHYLVAVNRQADSVAESRRALALEPLNANIAAHLAWALYYARQYDDAIEQCRKTIELDPVYYQGYLFRGMVLTQKGQFAEAQADFERTLAIQPARMQVLGFMGHSLGRAGRGADAERVAREFAADSKDFSLNADLGAMIYTGLGDHARALDLLEKAYDQRAGQIVNINVEPVFDALRSEPRFQALVRKMGLSQ